MSKTLRFTHKVFEKVLKTTPTNEDLVAADLRVTVDSIRRVVDTAVKYGYMERLDLGNGYVPHLMLTLAGAQELHHAQRLVRIANGGKA